MTASDVQPYHPTIWSVFSVLLVNLTTFFRLYYLCWGLSFLILLSRMTGLPDLRLWYFIFSGNACRQLSLLKFCLRTCSICARWRVSYSSCSIHCSVKRLTPVIGTHYFCLPQQLVYTFIIGVTPFAVCKSAFWCLMFLIYACTLAIDGILSFSFTGNRFFGRFVRWLVERC